MVIFHESPLLQLDDRGPVDFYFQHLKKIVVKIEMWMRGCLFYVEFYIDSWYTVKDNKPRLLVFVYDMKLIHYP